MRPRLTRLLEQGLQGALTLLCAPAGFGKTTLLVEWLVRETATGSEARRVAWLALEADDNDPARFVACLAAALERIRPGVELAAQHLSRSPRPLATAPRTVLALLINTLESSAENAPAAPPAVLLLDDYHVITNPAIHDAMAFLLDHLPASLRLVMATRANPPLPLARLRARGQLTEIRAGELRFTPPETAELLNGLLNLGLTPADVSAVDERTEGWAAGLHLAAMALRGPARLADRGALVAALAGSQRFILDFLAEEVINRQPAHVREFLLQTCLLRRLCAPLCETVATASSHPPSHPGSQALLDHLERNNLFLAPLDQERRWYRYHPLFAEALLSVARPTPAAAAETHRRAAGWFSANGMLTEAVWHALAAPDPDQAADLIEASYHHLIQRGELVTLENWLKALPPGMVDSRTRLSLAAAWAGAYSASQADFERHLRFAEAALPSLPEAARGPVRGELAALNGVYASTHWQTSTALRLAREALEQLPPASLWLRSIAYQALGNAHRLRGEAAAAERAYREVMAYSQAEGAPLFGLIAASRLGQVQIQQGQLRAAAETLRSVEKQAIATAGALPMFAGEALVHLAEIMFEWDEVGEAKATLQRGLEWAAQGQNAVAGFAGRLLRARLEAAQGNFGAARAALRQAGDTAARQGFAGMALEELAAATALVDLAADDVAAAGEWAARQPTTTGEHERDLIELTLARVRLAQGRPSDALRHIAAARRAAADHGRTGTLTACLALTALALHAQRETPKALAALAQALAQAEPEGYVRLFREAGPAMADLLARVRGPQQAYAEHLRSKWGPAASRPAQAAHLSGEPAALVEPLSARETEVLRWLAGGASNRVIAEALVISVGTVKTHISRIMGKLDARNRTEAVARARQVGLLE